MPKGFVSLGKGLTLNQSLVKDVYTADKRYFVTDVYGIRYQVNFNKYQRIKEVTGK